jgi:SAM-dependent methyltransferase
MLPEGVYVKSLEALGIMDNQGKVFPTRRDKFNQINRFLEVVSEIFTPTDTEKQIVVDFGCGKAYLTFALMEILNQQKSKVEMVGIDRKKDVIDSNNQLVKNLGWSQMSFVTGNIDDPLPYKKVNIVLSLHACDTATDDAILQGLKYTADWILVAPCCQHELYNQIKTPTLHPLLKHGILKERISSILTDAIRADILEAFGYKVDVIEFVDTQHTPKNIMLRAKRCSDSFSKEKYEKCLTWTRELGVSPYIIENLEKIF